MKKLRKIKSAFLFAVFIVLIAIFFFSSAAFARADSISTWAKTYGSRLPYDYVRSAQQTEDGGYILAGWTLSSENSYDGWILKLNANGDIEWQRTYGGSGSDFLESIRQTSDNGYVVIGHTWSFGAGGSDAWVLKLDAYGNIQWQKTYGGSGYESYAYLNSTADGGYVLTGRATSFIADKGVWVLKLDSDGNIYGCPARVLNKSEGTAINTDAIMINTTVTPQNTTISPQTSNALVTDTHVTSDAVCVEAAPDISLNPTSLKFGSVALPGSFTQSVVISNSGSANLTINSVNITGANASDFSQGNNCSAVVPNGSCTVTVTFTPTSIGARSASLSISSNDPNAPTVDAPLIGEGVDTVQPTVTITINPALLWPPNHMMVDVLIGGTALDSGSGIASVEIMVADEYGVYNMTVPGFGSTVRLEAWREGADRDGRKYTVMAVATDKAGNQATAVTEVIVPHDMR